MYGSKAKPYKVVDATPFKRDSLRELRHACDAERVRLGCCYSQSWDWHEPDTLGRANTWDCLDRSRKDKVACVPNRMHVPRPYIGSRTKPTDRVSRDFGLVSPN
jgi:hypothetical protein